MIAGGLIPRLFVSVSGLRAAAIGATLAVAVPPVFAQPAPTGEAAGDRTTEVTDPAAGPPVGEEARTRYDRGLALYAARAYAEARVELAASYALEPRRDTLFAQAQATRLAGDCAAARGLYERFLATNPPERQIDATKLALARCDELAPRPVPRPTPPPPSPAPSQPVARDRSTTPWWRDRAGSALVLAGTVVAAAGAGLVVAAHARADEQQPGQTIGDYESDRDGASRLFAWGVGALAVGGAAVLGGVGRWVWVSARPQQDGVAFTGAIGGRF